VLKEVLRRWLLRASKAVFALTHPAAVENTVLGTQKWI
jgi:hypothetical protein